MPPGDRVTVKEKANIQRKLRLQWWGIEVATGLGQILLHREPRDTRYTLTLTAHEIDHLFDLVRFGLHQLEHETQNYFAQHTPPDRDDPLYIAQFRKESGRASDK